MLKRLPSKPHLEHLKSQAKDLLDAHRRGDPVALSRIREAVPAYGSMRDAAIATVPFALHDAQSAIAREYGYASWVALRAHVSAVHSQPTPPPIHYLSGDPVPSELADAIRAALLRRGSGAGEPTPEEVPLLPLRNAVVFPGALIPLDVARPRTLRGIHAAFTKKPAFIALFTQRDGDVEVPATEDLYPTGCLCVIRHVQVLEGGTRGWIIAEGIRWVSLDSIEQIDPYYIVSIANTSVQRDDEQQVMELDRELRTKARLVVAQVPEIRDAALGLIDSTVDIAQLADLVMANLTPPVAEAAAYADDLMLTTRLRRVIALLDQALSAA